MPGCSRHVCSTKVDSVGKHVVVSGVPGRRAIVTPWANDAWSGVFIQNRVTKQSCKRSTLTLSYIT